MKLRNTIFYILEKSSRDEINLSRLHILIYMIEKELNEQLCKSEWVKSNGRVYNEDITDIVDISKKIKKRCVPLEYGTWKYVFVLTDGTKIMLEDSEREIVDKVLEETDLISDVELASYLDNIDLEEKGGCHLNKDLMGNFDPKHSYLSILKNNATDRCLPKVGVMYIPFMLSESQKLYLAKLNCLPSPRRKSKKRRK